jgi:hypothetical protein
MYLIIGATLVLRARVPAAPRRRVLRPQPSLA